MNEPLVRQDGSGEIELFNPLQKNWVYCFQSKEVVTRRGLIHMIRHLTEKNWITPTHIRELVDVSYRLVGKSPYGG